MDVLQSKIREYEKEYLNYEKEIQKYLNKVEELRIELGQSKEQFVFLEIRNSKNEEEVGSNLFYFLVFWVRQSIMSL